MTIGRYQDSEISLGKSLPYEWQEGFIKILNDTYSSRSENDNCFFDVYGKIFEKEFLAIISYIHKEDYSKSPITLFISHDIIEDSKALKTTLDDLVNLTGLIFDDIFSTEYWSDYNSNWTENKTQHSSFFYKITRENISLTLQAEALLNKTE